MPERRTHITIPFVEGLDQTVENLNDFNFSLNACSNAVFKKDNSIQKRKGFTNQGQQNLGPSLKTCRMQGTQNALYSFTNDGYMSSVNDGYFFNQNNSITSQVLKLPEFINESQPVVAKYSDDVTQYSDVCATPNHVAWVYKDNVDDYIKAVVKNRKTGAVVFNEIIAEDTDAKWPRLTPSGNREELILFTYVLNADLYAKVINTTNESAVVAYNTGDIGAAYLTDTDGYHPGYDCCPRPASGWNVAYHADQNTVVVRQIVGAFGTITGTSTIVPASDTNTYGLSIANTCSDGRTDDGYVWTAFYDGYDTDGIYLWASNDTFIEYYFQSELIAAGARTYQEIGQIGLCRAAKLGNQDEADGYHLLVSYTATTDYDPDYPANGTGFTTNITTAFITVDGAANVTAAGSTRGLHPISKPWHWEGNTYQWFSDFVSRTNYLMELPRNTGISVYPRAVTTANYNQAYSQLQHKMMTVSNPEDGTFITGARYFITGLTGDNLNDPNQDYKVGLTLYESKNDTDYLYQLEEVAGVPYISGGNLSMYDGKEIQENNFIQSPRIDVVQIDNDTNNPLPAGIYNYCAVYEYIDNAGLKHFSVPSNVASIDIKYTPDKIGESTYVDTASTGDVTDVSVGTTGPDEGVNTDGYYVITTGGGRNTARFKVSDDGGSTLYPLEYLIDSDGEVYVSALDMTFEFPDSTFTIGDSGTFHIVDFEGGTQNEDLIGAKVVIEIDDSITTKFKYRIDRMINGSFVSGITAGPFNIPQSDDEYKFQIQDGYVAEDGYGVDSGIWVVFGDHENYQSTNFWTTTIRQKTGCNVRMLANQNTYRYDGRSIIVPYRTQANGTVYYRMPKWEEVDTWSMSASGGSGLVNVPTSNTTIYTFQDLVEDEDLLDSATLYAPPDQSGVLPNDHPWGGVKGLKYHKNRLFMISAENPTRLLYTKEYVANEALAYSLGQELDIGDRIVAMSSHDEALVVLTEGGISIVLGQGPDATGDPRSGSFEIFRLNGLPGCCSPRSVVTIPEGTLYQANRGIVLLTKGYQQINIGEDISGTLTDIDSDDDKLKSSVIDPRNGIIIWIKENSQQMLVLNYEDLHSQSLQARARWCTWQIAETSHLDTIELAHFKGNTYAVWIDDSEDEGKFLMYDTDGTQYLDDGSIYNLSLSSNWCNFGNNHEKRLRKAKIVMVTNSGCTLTIYNVDAPNVETTSYSAGNTDLPGITFDLVHYCKYQRGRAWAFYFTDDGANSGVSLFSLDLEIGPVREGMRRRLKANYTG